MLSPGDQCTSWNKIIIRFERVSKFLCFSTQDFLNIWVEAQTVKIYVLNIRSKISYAGCLVFSVILTQFTVKICVANKNGKKITKKRFFCISNSFKVVYVGILRKLVRSVCHDNKQQNCVYLQRLSR